MLLIICFLNNLLLHLNEMCHIGNYKEHVYHDNSQHIHQAIIIFWILPLTFWIQNISYRFFFTEHVCIIQECFGFLSEYRFQLFPLAVAFILGTVFGCVINIFPILFCRNRYLDTNVYMSMKMRKIFPYL